MQGDVIRLVDVNGSTAAHYEYDPYGNAIQAAGSHCNINPLRYRGYVYDTESGLYYLQSRYYDPKICRFINADAFASTGQGILGHNMFAYCLNNPACRKDVSGATAQEIFDSDGNPLTDDDKRFDGGRTSDGQSDGSMSHSTHAQTGSSNTSPSGDTPLIPKYAYDTLEYIKSHTGSPPYGYKGGSSFANDGRDGGARLPDCYAPYREYDVHAKVAGQNRGAERIVVGIGAAFYTPNHYMTFIKME